MARIIFLLALLNLSVSGHSSAQIRVTPLSLSDTGKAELYLFFNNHLRVEGLSAGDKVYFGDRSLNPNNSGDYVLSPVDTSENILTVRNKNKVVFSRQFVVKRVPEIRVTLGQIAGTYATVAEILEDPTLRIKAGNLKDWFSIVSFELGIQGNGGFEQTPMLGSRLSLYQTDIIRKLVPGDKLYIENIRATCPDCTTRMLNSFIIIIK